MSPRLSTMTILMRVILSVLLVWSAVTKLADPAAFADAIERYRLVPPLAAGALALYLPWLELILVAGWWHRSSRRAAGVLILALLLIYTLAVALSWVRGLDIRCGCFGKVLDASLPMALARDILLVAMSAWICRVDRCFKDKHVVRESQTV